MIYIVLASARAHGLAAFEAALSSDPEVHFQRVGSGAEALETARTTKPQLIIIDGGLGGAEPLELVQQLLMVNAMVNSAVISPLAEAEFHEVSEGLGVLGRLPEEPDANDAADLLIKLKKVLGVSE